LKYNSIYIGIMKERLHVVSKLGWIKSLVKIGRGEERTEGEEEKRGIFCVVVDT